MLKVGVLLASGGMRCFYQLGVLEMLRSLPLQFELMVGISGGALATVTYLSESTEEMLEATRRAGRSGDARLRPYRLLRGRSPFPHEDLIQRTLSDVLTEERLKQVVASKTEVRILAAQLDSRLPYAVAGTLQMQAHAMEIGPLRKLWMHPVVGRWVGFKHREIVVEPHHSGEDLIRMLRVTSAFPPVTAQHRFDGRTLYDGAFFSSMPDFYAYERNHRELDVMLVLHTRSDQAGLFRDRPRLWHIKPSRRLKVGIWEYGNELGMFQAYQVGQNDGRALVARLEQRLRR